MPAINYNIFPDCLEKNVAWLGRGLGLQGVGWRRRHSGSLPLVPQGGAQEQQQGVAGRAVPAL